MLTEQAAAAAGNQLDRLSSYSSSSVRADYRDHCYGVDEDSVGKGGGPIVRRVGHAGGYHYRVNTFYKT